MIIPAHTLRDLLVGAALAATRDITLPVLHTVHLRWTPTGEALDNERRAELVAEATDRYRMHEGTTTVVLGDDEGAGEALVDRVDVELLVKVLPSKVGRRGEAPDAVVELDGDKLLVEVDGNVRRLPLVDAQFPKVAALWPTDESRAMVDGVAFNPQLVADLAKIPTGSRVAYWQWNFTANRHGAGPALVRPMSAHEHPAIAWRACVMPVRLAG